MASRLAGVFAALLLAGSLSAQQFNGVGASLTTSSPGRMGPGSSFGTRGFGFRGGFSTPGIPASVTSIAPGPSGQILGRFGKFGNRGFHHGRRGFGKNFVPIFVPYYSYSYPYYYPYGDSGLYPDMGTADNMAQQEPEDMRPALTIFENRPGYRPPPVSSGDSRDYDNRTAGDDRAAAPREAQPAPEPEPAVDQTPTVLVFQDGHQIEIGNYAIQGDLLYNLDGKGPRKIKLADLDLDKTVQVNDERGNPFHLPRKYRG